MSAMDKGIGEFFLFLFVNGIKKLCIIVAPCMLFLQIIAWMSFKAVYWPGYTALISSGIVLTLFFLVWFHMSIKGYSRPSFWKFLTI